MKKIYLLPSCNTCQRILHELEEVQPLEVQDIKSQPISAEQLRQMQEQVGSYEALFSRRARKYRAMGLHEQELTEADYERLILSEYTFLKRPVMVIGEEVFVGNAKKTVAAAKAKLAEHAG